jgi:hypothetical protein
MWTCRKNILSDDDDDDIDDDDKKERILKIAQVNLKLVSILVLQ